MPVPASYNLKDKYGVSHTLYYKERMSAVTGIPVHTLTLWDKRGIIPFTPFRDSAGRKLYAQQHITAVDETLTNDLTASGIYDINLESLRDALRVKFKLINASMAQKFKGVENYESQKEAKARSQGRRKRTH